MGNKNRRILNYLVSIGGVQYVVGRLRFNAGEFSYFFTYPSDSPETHLNCDTGESTAFFDHITWHDGQIHIKRKDNVAIEVLHYDGKLLSNPPVVTPLYVESMYFKDRPCLVNVDQFKPWSGSVSQEILSLDTSEGFSLIFMLVPSKDPTPNILAGFQSADIPEGLSHPLFLADLCDDKHRPGRIAVWEGWDVLVLVTRFVQRTLTPIPVEIGPCRLPNYRNVPAALTDLMRQANGL